MNFGIKSIKNKMNPIIVAAFLTGIALVISQAWGQAIKKTIAKIVNKIQCSEYLLHKDKTKHKECTKHHSLISLYINAILTSILVFFIVYFLFGNKKSKISK